VTRSFALVVFTAVLTASACSRPPEGPADIIGTSAKFTVTGRYAPLAIDRVDSLSIEGGKLAVHGSTTQMLDLPPEADAGKPSPHWSLTNENDVGAKHSVNFTHDITLDEFTIELPAGTADVHYGTLKSRTGDAEVMLLAWGQQGKSYEGYVSILPKPEAAARPDAGRN
jgi:hypothetical protein